LAAHLDILASFFIGGLLLLMVLNMNAGLLACTQGTGLNMVIQQNAVSTVELVDRDLRRAGLRVSGTPFLAATDTSFAFVGDVDSDGVPDTVRYRLGSTSTLSGTPNPRDRMLYRKVNSGPEQAFSGDVVSMKVTYLDPDAAVIPTPVVLDQIRALKVEMHFESGYSYGGEYAELFLEFSVTPKSIGG